MRGGTGSAMTPSYVDSSGSRRDMAFSETRHIFPEKPLCLIFLYFAEFGRAKRGKSWSQTQRDLHRRVKHWLLSNNRASTVPKIRLRATLPRPAPSSPTLPQFRQSSTAAVYRLRSSR